MISSQRQRWRRVGTVLLVLAVIVALNVAANLALPALDLDRPEWLGMPDRPDWLALPGWLGWVKPTAKVVRAVVIGALILVTLIGVWEQHSREAGGGADQSGEQ